MKQSDVRRDVKQSGTGWVGSESLPARKREHDLPSRGVVRPFPIPSGVVCGSKPSIPPSPTGRVETRERYSQQATEPAKPETGSLRSRRGEGEVDYYK